SRRTGSRAASPVPAAATGSSAAGAVGSSACRRRRRSRSRRATGSGSRRPAAAASAVLAAGSEASGCLFLLVELIEPLLEQRDAPAQLGHVLVARDVETRGDGLDEPGRLPFERGEKARPASLDVAHRLLGPLPQVVPQPPRIDEKPVDRPPAAPAGERLGVL